MKDYLLVFLIMFSTKVSAKTWNFDGDISTENQEESKTQRVLGSIKKRVKKQRRQEKGNLPNYAIYKGELGWGEIKGPMSLTSDDSYYVMKKIKAGDEFKLGLDNIVYAIEDKKVAVSGTVLSGKLMGYSVVGHTRLEPYSKKILVDFTTLIDEEGDEYVIRAHAIRHGDQFFKPTKYISKKRKYLLGRVLSAFGASFLESKVRVNQTLLGQVQSNDVKSSGYSAGRDGMEVISNDFKDAMNNSKDVAYIAQKMMYQIKFLNSPKSK